MVLAALTGLALAVLPSRAPADSTPAPTPTPNVYRSLDAETPRDAGSIHGTIESIDYAAGMIVVRAKGHRSHTVAIVPSTAIYRGRQVQSLSDLRRGQYVDVEVYMTGGRLVARTITLR